MDAERGVNTYWLKYPVRTGVGHKHSLRFEGGDEVYRYSVGLSYNDIAGAMKGSNRRTFNGNVFLSYKYKNLTFQMIYKFLLTVRIILLMEHLMILRKLILIGLLMMKKGI